MSSVAFSSFIPDRVFHVTVGIGNGDGSVGNPFHSIQQAVNAATPGTAIVVHAGTYPENIKIPSGKSGTADMPIWLVSGDGPQAAKIVGVSDTLPVIQALGVDNYIIKNFDIVGGYDGIQFSQSGREFTNLVSNVVIQGNMIGSNAHDGIKVGQADNVYVLDNTVKGVGEEGIDFVAVTHALIARNDVSSSKSSAAGIFAKGGSTNILIEDNYVHNVRGDGISAGGNTDAASFKPGYTGYEGKNIDVIDNKIEDADKRPVSVRGAIDVEVSGNYLDGSAKYHNGVYITAGNPAASPIAYSTDVRVVDNIVENVGSVVVKIDPGNDNGIIQSGNMKGLFTTPVGPNSNDLPLWPSPAAENEAPTAVTLSPVSASLAENSDVTNGILVADIAVIDDSLGTNTLRLTGPDAASFAIGDTLNGGHTLYYVGHSPDYEIQSSYAVSVSVQDVSIDGSVPIQQDFTVTIEDINEGPTAVNFSNTLSSLVENSDVTGGIKVADLAVADDALSTNTLSLSGGDSSAFEIRAAGEGGLALYYIGASPNFETKNSYAVTVNAVDATVIGSTAVHSDFTLAISDANEAATGVTLLNTQSVLENSDVAGGVRVADIAVADDTLGANTIELSGPDATSFAVRNTLEGGHTLYYIGASPDYEVRSSYAVTVTVQDLDFPAGPTHVQQDLILGVADVNEAPTAITLSNTLSSLAENSDVTGGIKVADVTIADDALGTNALSVSGPDAASFAIRALTGGGFGLYYVGSSPDYETKNSYTVDIDAADATVVGSSAAHQSFTLAITDVLEGSVTPVNLTGTAGDDTLAGGASNDKIDGAAGNDVLYGLGGNDTLTSGPGVDKLYGGDGDDTLITKRGTGPDFFDGGNGVDLVNIDLAKVSKPLSLNLSDPGLLQNLGDGSSLINVEKIIIVGGTGADHFIGGPLADTLNGYDGNDVLQGGGGDDVLTGGVGNDTFVYNSKSWGNDKITDFEDNRDLFDLRATGLNFNDLSLSQQGADILITTSDQASSIVVQHTQLAQIAANDFLF